MEYSFKWYGHFVPIAVDENEYILAYRMGWLYTINCSGVVVKISQMPFTLIDRLKESFRIVSRLFRKDIRCSCVTREGDVYFFKDIRERRKLRLFMLYQQRNPLL